jgi:hypothetical protein
MESDSFLVPCRDDAAALASALDWLSGVRNVDREVLAGVASENAARLFGDSGAVLRRVQ